MKNILTHALVALLAIIVFVPSIVFATATSWDYTANVLRPLQSMWTKEVKVPYITATSTTATSTFPKLSVSNRFSFGGVSGTTWSAFCNAITGGSGLCDGVDNTGAGGTSGVATTTPWTIGNLAYVKTAGSITSVATGTLTENVSGLQFDATRGLVGGAAVLSLSSGFTIPSTTLLSNVGTFYNTPSNRITAGTFLGWNGNTLYSTALGTSSFAGLFNTNLSGKTTDNLTQGATNLYNQTHTGEVTGATALTVADNSIDEANLKITGSPTNKYLLQASSSAAGGFAWVATSTLGLGGSAGTVSSVAATVPTGFSISGSPITTSGTLGITYTAGYELFKTASGTNWNGFYNTPSTRISDGTGLTWSGNTLNCDTTTGSVQGCLTAADWLVFNRKVASTAIDTSAELKTLVTDETGTGGALVFATAPVLSSTTITGRTKLTNASTTNLSVATSFDFLGTVITNVSTWFNGLFDTRLAAKTTDNLTQGATNLYNQTHTGEVTGATALTIADNMVDEANLKITGSPTNKYVLVASSSAAGGLAWVATSTLINASAGGGSGTVNTGNTGQTAIWNATGTAVSATSSINIRSGVTSLSSGAFTVDSTGAIKKISNNAVNLTSASLQMVNSGAFVKLQNNASAVASGVQLDSGSNGGAITFTSGVSDAEAGRFTTAGRLGIATTAPRARLEVRANGATTSIMSIASTTGARILEIPASTGFLGLGTSTPDRRLSVSGDIRLTGALYDSLNSAGTLGKVLRSTATGIEWVATSTLGLGSGGSGLTSLNGQTGSSQTFASSSAGTDVQVRSSGNVHTFQWPSASSVARGFLTAADWLVFNRKVSSTSIDTSAELKALVTDETGSGALVFGTTATLSSTTLSGRTTLASASTTKLTLLGAVYDSLNSAGTNGMVLKSTASGVQWVATSTLGLGAGGGSGTVNSGNTGQFPFYSATGTALTATSTVRLSRNGRFSINSSTPSALFSIKALAGFTSDILDIVTSTGAKALTILNSGFVGIGSETPNDQLTVKGRINTEDWYHDECEGIANQTSVSADGPLNTCTGYLFYEDTVATLTGTIGNGFPFNRMSTAAATDGAGVFLAGTSGGVPYLKLASSTPVIEVNARINTPQNASSSKYYIGYTSMQAGSSAFEAEPTSGCYLVSSTTQANWRAICRTSAANVTNTDTGVASTTIKSGTGTFRRFRIEASGTSVVFKIKNTETSIMSTVATIATNIPSTTAMSAGIWYSRNRVSLNLSDFDFFALREWWKAPLGS